MKVIIKILLLLSLIILINACAKSLIKIVSQKDDNPVSVFAESGERNFFIPVELGDSLNLLWENDVHGSFNNSSFIFYDSSVFVHDLGGRIHVFNIYNGKQLGVLKFKGSVLSAPVLSNYNLIVPLVLNNEDLTELIIYDFFHGKEIKIIEIKGRVITQLLKIGEDIIVCTERGSVIRYNSKGSEIWNTNINSFIRSNPAYSEGKIYIATVTGEFICLDSESSTVIFRKKISDSFSGGITIKEEMAYVGDVNGVIYALDINDGSTVWKFSTGSRINMNPAADNESLFVGNLAGKLFSLNLTDGKLNWERSFEGAVFNSTPLITNDRIILSNLFKSVYIISKGNSTTVKEIFLDERVKMTPAIRNNILIIGYDRGTVRAYEIIN